MSYGISSSHKIIAAHCHVRWTSVHIKTFCCYSIWTHFGVRWVLCIFDHTFRFMAVHFHILRDFWCLGLQVEVGVYVLFYELINWWLIDWFTRQVQNLSRLSQICDMLASANTNRTYYILHVVFSIAVDELTCIYTVVTLDNNASVIYSACNGDSIILILSN